MRDPSMNPTSSLTRIRRRCIASIGALIVICSGMAGSAVAAETKQWVVPLGGNAYLTSAAAGSQDKVEPSGIRTWRDEASVFSIFFRADRAAELKLSLRLKVPDGESVIRATAGGSVFEMKITGAGAQDILLGKIPTQVAGYVMVELQGRR